MRIVTSVVLMAAAGLLVAGCSTTAGVAEPEEEVTVTVTDTTTADTAPSEPTVPETSTEETESESTTELPQPTTSPEPDDDEPGADGSIPAEPENPPAGDDACTIDDLTIGIDGGEGAAGSIYYQLTFTNTGARTCTMQGFPKVVYVRGDAGRATGSPAVKDGDVGKVVTLAPGDHAVADLQQVNVYNFDEDDCKPVNVRGLRVYPPGQDSAAFVPQDGAVGCRSKDLVGGQFQMSVQTITAG